MSEREEHGLDELERRLDAAFRATRPRRGFEDELWASLQARRPWWRRLGGAPRGVTWAAAGGLALLLVVGLGVVGLARLSGPHTGGSASSASQPISGQRGAAPAVSSFSTRLPAPAQAGVPQVIRQDGTLSPLPAGGVRMVLAPADGLPEPSQTMPVYTYAAGAGPADGAIVTVGQVPSARLAGSYPTRPLGAAFAEAAARAAGAAVTAQQSEVTVRGASLVYVAVVAGGQGYLEPAYLATGTAQVGGESGQVQVLIPALAASVLR